MKYLRSIVISLLFLILLTNCGGNKGPETPSSPQGPTIGEPNTALVFQASTTDPDGDNISYQFDWGDGSASPWTDFIPSGDAASVSRIYSAEGTYQVRVHAQDEKEKTSEWSEPHSISIAHPDTTSSDTNSAPLTPNSPEGPMIGVPNIAQTYRASTTDPDGNNISYQFDWGDGTVSPWTDFIPSGDTVSINRIYPVNGTYQVRVQARDEEQKTSGWSEPLSFVIGFPDEVVSNFGTGIDPYDIEVLPNGQYIYVTNYDDGTIRVIDGSSNSPMGDISVGLEPMGVTALPNSQYIYIMLNGDDAVISLSTTDDDPTRDTIPVSGPVLATALPNGEYLYVTSPFTGNVYIIRTSDNTLVDSVHIGGMPFAIEALPDGDNVYVSTSSSNTYVIRTSDNTVVDNLSIGGRGLCASPDGEHVYISSNFGDDIYVVQTSNNAVVDTVRVGNNPVGICVHPSGQLVYVANNDDDNVSVIYTPTNKVVKTIQAFDGPTFIDASPDGEYIYVLHNNTYAVAIIGYSE
jgi:YVTN family beta-propeller protein